MGWLVGHLVGDFLLQNDWMALGKKKAHIPCLVHVTLYTLAVLLFTGWWSLTAAAIVFVPHYLIDRWSFVPFYMRLVGQQQFMTGPCSPWSYIAVDNTMHFVCLFLTALYLGD